MTPAINMVHRGLIAVWPTPTMLTRLFLLTNLAVSGADVVPVGQATPGRSVPFSLQAPGTAALGSPVDARGGIDAPPAAVFRVLPPGSLPADEGEPEWARNPQEIPLPPAVWMGLSALAAVAGARAVRRRRLNSAIEEPTDR